MVCLALVLLLIPTGFVKGALQRRTSSRVRRVDELFNKNCARCHGTDGRSDTPQGHLFKAPDFTDPDWWKKNSSATSTRVLRSIVTRGKAAMPAFGKKLTRSEISLLVDSNSQFSEVRKEELTAKCARPIRKAPLSANPLRHFAQTFPPFAVQSPGSQFPPVF